MLLNTSQCPGRPLITSNSGLFQAVCVWAEGAEAVITLCKGLPMEMFIVALFIVLKN